VAASAATQYVLSRHSLWIGAREQAVQRLLPAPIDRVAEPSCEQLLALTLEAYDQAEIGAVDRRRHHLELSDLGRAPHAPVTVAVLDWLTQALPRNGPGHVQLGCKLDAAERGV